MRIHWLLFLLTAFLISCQSSTSPAKLKLPTIIGSHMVLQQHAEAAIWGWAEPGATIIVKGSWPSLPQQTTTSQSGRWEVGLPTPEAGGPFTIEVKEAENSILLEDVLIGEVWLGSGQSNMEWPVHQADQADQEIAAADFPEIRIFTVEKATADTPLEDAVGEWKVCKPTTIGDFSAVAYFFGRELHQELGYPVGLIASSWGGTPIQAWTNREALSHNPVIKASLDLDAILDELKPATLYNAMIAPLVPFTLTGVIWYQGEADTYRPIAYEELLPNMIRQWRKAWGQEFSFYFVQIAPFAYETPLSAAALRESQRKTLSLPRTGMAATMDIGNPDDIHPTNKQDVGKRLALWALAKDYGKDIVFSGPLFTAMELLPPNALNPVRLHFAHAEGGLVANGPLTHFELAGKDEVFYPAEAQLDANYVYLKSEKVPRPVAARYAFSNTAESNLFNQAGLPVSPFRTDDWPLLFTKPKIDLAYDRVKDRFRITIDFQDSLADIHYTLDGQKPNNLSPKYTERLSLSISQQIKAVAYKDGEQVSRIAEREILRHKGMQAEIINMTTPSKRYLGKGKYTLTNGLLGTTRFDTPEWLGFEGEDVDIVIDLGEPMKVDRISIRFLESQGAWIFLPKSLEIKGGLDPQNLSSLLHPMDMPVAQQKKASIVSYGHELEGKEVRYLSFHAQTLGTCPSWHQGAGGKAWLFLDEIIIY